jgi:predicted dehydrogenase
MDDKVRLGVAGIGNIATLNVAGYRSDPRCEIVALADPREDKARRIAEEWGVGRVHTSLDALLADDEVDAVEILTPTYMHKDHVVAAARAGKHISVQKPMANSVADCREMLAAVEEAGVTFRVTENCFHYPPLVKARQLVNAGAIGTPTMVRIKTVVGHGVSDFQNQLEPEGYIWRFNEQSPGGHLFDDMIHKYATACWLVPEAIKSVQAVVRQGPLFFEPMAAFWEYERDDLLGMMDVEYAPEMTIPGKYWGADEWWEIQGTEGLIWVTRLCAELYRLAPVVHFTKDGERVEYDVDGDYVASFHEMSRAFVTALIEGTQPDMTGEMAMRALQLCFAVYQASNEKRPVDPSTIDDKVSPPWWPPFKMAAR